MDARIAAAAAAAAAVALAAALAAWPGGGGQPGGDGSLGLVVNTPRQSVTLQELGDAYGRAASAGIGRSNVYMFWDAVEPEPGAYDWGAYDAIMGLADTHGLRVTLFFSAVNGRTLGPFPGWLGAPDAGSIPEDRLAAAIGAALSRYPAVDSVVFAGGLDDHFRHAEGGIPAFEDVFWGVHSRLKEGHPGVRVGNSFELNNVLAKGLEGTVRRLAHGDFVAYTYRPTDVLNEVSRTPAEAAADLRRMMGIVPGKPVVLLEAGWSTSADVLGSEGDQREFAALLHEFRAEHAGRLESATWYRLYDRPAGTCGVDESRLLGPATLGNSTFVIQRLDSYLCGAGLLGVGGGEKPAWAEFAAGARGGA